ncbi:MAG: ribosomal-protein-alanine N-acetyltransferase [Clostridium thermopalmarium]|uniref:ribosomal protein S18-alanine N-acetyltransferase n=1 Tax=Clostridium thermopalmarium TaxID=29373 RepID=UPI002354211A|nr:ribosomal protein S18-alanine N-acetyltransferase [Clostridium thermopalmarium]MBE6043125.1 ribosomal-protein-alanine N-acetyltransferase [Clostridium thermopalmarium]
MDNLVVHEIEECDLEDVLDIYNLSFTPFWSLDSLKNEIKNKFSKYIVVKKENKVIGFAALWIILDEINIINIAIHPNYRGIGASNLLMDAIIDICKEHKIPSITLEVRSNNIVAQNLYKKYGFTEEGLRKNYYGEELHAIIMWKRNIL